MQEPNVRLPTAGCPKCGASLITFSRTKFPVNHPKYPNKEGLVCNTCGQELVAMQLEYEVVKDE